MKQSHWLLCVAKDCDWSRKITPLSSFFFFVVKLLLLTKLLTSLSLLTNYKLNTVPDNIGYNTNDINTFLILTGVNPKKKNIDITNGDKKGKKKKTAITTTNNYATDRYNTITTTNTLF